LTAGIQKFNLPCIFKSLSIHFQEKVVQDELGLYYHPILENKKIRMYVRAGSDNIEFRMWNADDPQQAADFYKEEGRGKPPLHLYDIEIAERLLKDSL
jgi:hypothetical protein